MVRNFRRRLGSSAQLLLTVPAGTPHDAFMFNSALRVMQPAANEDFEIEGKFESMPSEEFQMQGLLVQQDDNTYLRFDVYSDASSPRIFSAAFAGNDELPTNPGTSPAHTAVVDYFFETAAPVVPEDPVP